MKRKRTLRKDEDRKEKEGHLMEKQGLQNEHEAERRKKKMKERDKLRNWDPAWRSQLRVQILGDSNLVLNWLNGRWKNNNQKFRMMVQRTQNVLDRTDIRLIGDHLDMLQHIYIEWNREADRLTHVAREKGATWNSYVIEEGAQIEAVRYFFDGGVSKECHRQIRNKVGSAYVIQIAENRGRIEQDEMEDNH